MQNKNTYNSILNLIFGVSLHMSNQPQIIFPCYLFCKQAWLTRKDSFATIW